MGAGAMQPDIIPLTIAEWPRNNRETIRVRLDTYNGRPVVDCRAWYHDAAGELRPGRSGLTLSARHLSKLSDALAAAVTDAQRIGLIET
jgi:hypothetical protein